jgi:hypothetical protein
MPRSVERLTRSSSGAAGSGASRSVSTRDVIENRRQPAECCAYGERK